MTAEADFNRCNINGSVLIDEDMLVSALRLSLGMNSSNEAAFFQVSLEKEAAFTQV